MKKVISLILVLTACIYSNAQPDMLILGGELSNSAATCFEDIDEVMPRMKELGLNTVLVPAYWELLEKEEGEFDFSLIDRIVQQARTEQLKVVFLWFGAWKNSMSCYAPGWFKTDYKRFPRAVTKEGKPLEIASCFSENVFQADNKAFCEFVRHISQTAKDVVVMIQVENEIGMLEDARDYSKPANDAYKKGVPQELIDYLDKNRKSLHPWLSERINSKLYTKGARLSWVEAFGDDIYTDEIFMAYYYARYVGRLCESARGYTDMPLYVNAAMNSRGREPGQYPSAGPLAHLIDLWHCGAPQLLCLAPDIYDTGFKSWADQYALPGNPLFIPESRCCENSGARAMYAIGEHHAIGFAPFAIDQAPVSQTQSVTRAYGILRQLYSLSSNRPGLKSKGLLFDEDDKERIITDKDIVITCRHYYTLPWDSRASDGSTWPEGGAVLLKLAKNEYVLAGTGVVVSFASVYEHSREQQLELGEDGFAKSGSSRKDESNVKAGFSGTRKGILSVDEVIIDESGNMQYLRRHNGDQDHQGRHARISCDDWMILHIRLYDYAQ